MGQNIQQHQAFSPGLDDFMAYVKECVKTDGSGRQYNAQQFRHLIDVFGTELALHLEQEIETFLSLEKYDTKILKREFKRFDEVQQNTDKVSCNVPFYLNGRLYIVRLAFLTKCCTVNIISHGSWGL